MAKRQIPDTTRAIIERIKSNLEDHQGCQMAIGLTQALIKDCNELLKRVASS